MVKRPGSAFLLCVLALWLSACAQQKSVNTTELTVQPLPVKPDVEASHILTLRMRLEDQEEKPRRGVVGVLFAIYEQQTGGVPRWQEVQNVELSKHGVFTAKVGSTKSQGIDPELFHGEKIRWMGLQVLLPGEREQPRIKLVSTPNGLVADQATRLVIPENALDPIQAKGLDNAESTATSDPTSLPHQNPFRRRSLGARRRATLK